MTQVSLKRGNTWTFRFVINDANGDPIDLNGYTIFLTIKDIFDSSATDDGADYSASHLVDVSCLYYDFKIPHTATLIDPGLYHYGYRWIEPTTSDQYTSDLTFTVEETTTNRTSI